MRGPLGTVRELSPRIRAMLLVNAVNSFGGGLVFPFLWIYLTRVRDLPAWVPAVTLAVQAGTAVLGGLAWGSLLDRLAHRQVVPLVMTVAGVGTGLYALATGVWPALLAAVVYGLGISGVGTVLRAMYAGAPSSRERSLAYSADFAVFNAMTGVGVVVGGVVAEAGLGSLGDRYAGLYLADGVTFLIAGLALYLLLPRTAPAPEPAEPGAEPGAEPAAEAAAVPAAEPAGGYRAVLRDRRIAVLLGLLTLCSLVSYGQFRSGLPGYLTAHGALTAGGLSGTFAVNIVIAVAVQFVLGDRLRAVRRSTLLAATGLVWTLAWACVLLAGERSGVQALTAAIAGVILLSVGEALAFPVLAGLLNDLAQDALRGRVNALISVSISTGTMVGPLVAGAALPWGRGVPFVAGIVGACVVLAVAGRAMRGVLPASAELPGPEPDAAEPDAPGSDAAEADATGSDASETRAAEPEAALP